MAIGHLNNLVRQLRCQLGLQAARSHADAELLERFAARHEEAAFAALVERYGSIVLGVCRRVLGDVHDAEDAFQATFLTLARKAGSIRRSEAVGSWLYRVAYRVAVKARSHFAARRAQESAAAAQRPANEVPDLSWRELWPVLDEELNRLPEKYRAPLVLCFLQGRTNEEAAAELGWPAGSVRGRVARARALLRERLLRRGVTLPAAALVTAVSPTVASAALKEAALDTVLRDATGQAIAAPVQTLTQEILNEGVLHTMLATRARSAIVFLVSLVVVCGTGTLVWNWWLGSAVMLPPSASAHDAEAASAPARPLGELEHPQGVPDDKAAALIKELIPRASGSSVADWKRLATPGEAPTLEKMENQSLTMVLLALDFAEAEKEPAWRDFRYLQEVPAPHKLAESASRSQAKGYGTFIQPDFITGLTCRVKGDVATGTVSFRGLYFRVRDLRDLFAKGEPLYEGRVGYTARRVEDCWRIEEFRLPNYKLKVVRKSDGNWKKDSLVASAEPPADAADDATEKDRKALQGTWVAVSYEKAGGPAVATADKQATDAEKNLQLVIKGDAFTSSSGPDAGEGLAGSFKLDATQSPKTIDLRAEVKIVNGQQGKETTTLKLLGIYQLNGDELKICLQEKERPRDFSVKGATRYRELTLFKRQKE
jgi:RNA polymerase sigma factor (sigma-70 family)